MSDWEIRHGYAHGPKGTGASINADGELEVDYEYPLDGGGYSSEVLLIPRSIVVGLLVATGTKILCHECGEQLPCECEEAKR